MFKKILIANRGEIACRVIDTCRRMDVATVAVYSDVDRNARHVELATQAVHIGGAAPAESYLDGRKIIAAAKEKGAEAIHPGYGFLSENPDFVDAVEAAGLTFIGPSAEAIRAMGLKDAAKRLMAEAEVPVVPGYHGDDQEPGHLEVEADQIGYPLLIKAVAGGGGKGMRRVDQPEDFASALESARAEALGAFGNDAVLIEKFVEKPRHIEVQVFGDGTRAVHLFERDCSLQRRHQKVIEEAPAPGMTPEMRAAMGNAAVKAAEAIGYKGAGTVEFIVDASEGLRPDRFYFMEMNTRLQVEHPVSEAITGVDLVEWQLRVASGEPLPLTQSDLAISGHAFEARLYAEDVPAGFLPATGRLDHLVFPAGARIETGVRPGDEISPFYDPMIAKIVVHGADRGAALAALKQALAGTEIAGLTTNHAFLRKLVADARFASGDVDTGLIAAGGTALTDAPVPCTRSRSLGGIGALGLDQAQDPLAGFALWDPLPQRITVQHGHEDIEVAVVSKGPNRFEAQIDDARHQIVKKGGSWWVDGQTVPAKIARHASGVSVFWGNGYHYTVPDPLDRSSAGGPSGDTVLSPMPGLVRRVFAKDGQEVEAGDPMLILEAMKMEHTLRAPRDGVIARVETEEGAQVEAGLVLITLEPEA